MTRLYSHRIDTTKQQPGGNANLDANLIDEDFDDALDCQIAAFRESLADFRSI